jgi:hypothetical protein
MVTVKFEDLSLAFDFVSSGAPMEHQAYVSLDTGKIYWVSDLAPTDFEESDRYLEIPHKNELDLGQDLALRFAAREVPEAYDRVAAFFGHRGAYRRFKDYLAETGCLEKWYVFEAEQVDRALRAWCAANQIAITPETPSV